MPRPRGHGANYEQRRQQIIDLAAELSTAEARTNGAILYHLGTANGLPPPGLKRCLINDSERPKPFLNLAKNKPRMENLSAHIATTP